MNVLAIDVGGTFIKYGVLTEESEIIYKSKKSTKVESEEEFLKSLVDIYNSIKGDYDIDGIALSVPGVIDTQNGIMITGGSLACISNYPIVNNLAEICQVPVTVANDAKSAALAELWKGSLKDIQDAIVILCGTGIGGALIHNRQIIEGINHMAGEFSYIITDSDNEYELSAVLGVNAGIDSMLSSVSAVIGINKEELNGEIVFGLVKKGNEQAKKELMKYVRRIAVQITNYQMIMDPEKIVLGGGISAEPLFIELVKQELKKINDVYIYDMPLPNIETCKFYNDANLIGATYFFLQKR